MQRNLLAAFFLLVNVSLSWSTEATFVLRCSGEENYKRFLKNVRAGNLEKSTSFSQVFSLVGSDLFANAEDIYAWNCKLNDKFLRCNVNESEPMEDEYSRTVSVQVTINRQSGGFYSRYHEVGFDETKAQFMGIIIERRGICVKASDTNVF